MNLNTHIFTKTIEEFNYSRGVFGMGFKEILGALAFKF